MGDGIEAGTFLLGVAVILNGQGFVLYELEGSMPKYHIPVMLFTIFAIGVVGYEAYVKRSRERTVPAEWG